MWVTAQRLQADMGEAGYTHFFNNLVPLPPDADIQARLGTWEGLANSSVVWATFDGLRATARTAPGPAQFRSHVHGKNFWEKVVQPALRTIGQQTDWLLKLAEWSPSVPADMDAILRPLLA